MATAKDGNRAPQRLPTLRGSLMVDVVNGKVRIRAWPKKRGKPKNPHTIEQAEWFRQAQLATKYISPEQYRMWTEARAGTPILPRDVMTSMFSQRLVAIHMPNGKVLYPMKLKAEVSQALDTISQTPGAMLVRGEEFWEEGQGGGGAGAGTWSVLFDHEIDEQTPEVIVTDLPPTADLVVIGLNFASTVSALFRAHLSTDNGASFYDQSGDYLQIDANGTATPTNTAFQSTTASTVPRSLGGTIPASGLDGALKLCHTMVESFSRVFVADLAPINAMRFTPSAGNLTQGRIQIIGRV